MVKSFSIEDGNLQSRTLVVSRNVDYSDLDLVFETNTRGDVYRKLDAAAVRQSVKNIILTELGDKPFRPKFGTNIRSLLFENFSSTTKYDVDLRIRAAIKNREPRALVEDVIVVDREEENALLATIIFRVINTQELITLNVTLSRLR